jgi:hypothetical protein
MMMMMMMIAKIINIPTSFILIMILFAGAFKCGDGRKF